MYINIDELILINLT